jgi:hypothetical protein
MTTETQLSATSAAVTIQCDDRDRLQMDYLLAVAAFATAAKKTPNVTDGDAWRTEMQYAIGFRTDAFAALRRHKTEHQC